LALAQRLTASGGQGFDQIDWATVLI